MSVSKQLSPTEMQAMVRMDLFHHIIDAIGAFCAKEKTNVTCVEMTIAAVLGSELARSCNSTEEVNVNANAYAMFILSVGLGTFLAHSMIAEGETVQ